MQKIVETLTCKNGFLHTFFDFKKAAYSTLEIELETAYPENLEIVVGEVAENGRIVHVPGFRTFFQQIVQTGIGRQVIKPDFPYFQAYGEKAKEANEAAQKYIGDLERIISATKAESDIYKLNHSETFPVMVNDQALSLIKLALNMSDISDGAFNPCLYPVSSSACLTFL